MGKPCAHYSLGNRIDFAEAQSFSSDLELFRKYRDTRFLLVLVTKYAKPSFQCKLGIMCK